MTHVHTHKHTHSDDYNITLFTEGERSKKSLALAIFHKAYQLNEIYKRAQKPTPDYTVSNRTSTL